MRSDTVLSTLIVLSVLCAAVGNSQNVDDDGKIQREAPGATATTKAPAKPEDTLDTLATNCTNNSTCAKDKHDHSFFGGIKDKISQNKDMLLRTLYVLIGVTSIVIVYFIVKAWRVRRRRSKSRKYGLISTRGTDLEMAPLDQDDDDDEDMTVFELNGKTIK